MEYALGLLGGLSFLAVWNALTRPGGWRRAHPAQPQEQYRLREMRGGLAFLSAVVEDLAAWFRGPSGWGSISVQEDTTWRSGLNARYLQLLQQADWYWAPGETSPASQTAPFWNLETIWAAKVVRGGLFAVGGLLLAEGACLVMRFSPLVGLAGLLLGLVGFFDADREVAEAAEKRRRQIVLEMGYKVSELRVYVRSGRTFVSALRYLTSRPGGPFVRELHRALQVYDITADLSRGLKVVAERNRRCQPLVNLCGDLLAVLAEGGEVGAVLEAHADAAQHEQRRQLRQQGQDNTQQMVYLVSATTLVVIFALIGGPALWTVITSLAGW